MRLLFVVFALCIASSTATSAQYALMFGDAVAVSGDQILAGEGRNLLLPGNVFIFERDSNGTWEQVGTLKPEPSGNEALGFGRSLAAGGDVLAVGAPLQGAVYVFARNGDGQWAQRAHLESDAPAFGESVAVSGDHLLVVSTGNADAVPMVHAYRHVEGSWEAAGTLVLEADLRLDGSAIALEGSLAVVGVPSANGRAGAAFAYEFDADSGGWQASGQISFEDGATGDAFGSAVAFADGNVAIGAPRKGAGTVPLFSMDEEGQWRTRGHLSPAEGAENELFGAALAYTNGTLWVGAPGQNQSTGTTYVFSSLDGETAPGQHQPGMLQFRSNYGSRLAAAGDLVVAAARGHDNFEGAAFPLVMADDTWNVEGPIYHDAEFSSVTGGRVACEDGEAAAFPCSEVDMISFLTRREIGARRGIQVNDVWGWEDPETGREYALVGRTDGTSFIDLTDPTRPRYLGSLPKTATANQSLWRDIKVYKNHAFVVADGAGAHHMQIFDLTQLREVGDDAPVEFTETAIYKGVYSSHNLIINEETGFAYAVGNDSGGETCGGALHMINVQDPVNPEFAGCFADTRTGRRGTGSTHDAQCVTYIGPDTAYRGQEICLSSNGTALSIADVTDKENPVAISVVEYPNVAYTHQGWLTEDHRYFYLNDEGDEASGLVDATRTLIFDLADLDDPLVAGEYLGPSSAIDHNLYIRGNTMYQTNYVEGLRLIDITDPENPTEIGHFDTVPYGPNDNSPVLGAWSNYPYFKSGVIVVTSGREGVFFLKKKSIDI